MAGGNRKAAGVETRYRADEQNKDGEEESAGGIVRPQTRATVELVVSIVMAAQELEHIGSINCLTPEQVGESSPYDDG